MWSIIIDLTILEATIVVVADVTLSVLVVDLLLVADPIIISCGQ